MGRWRAHGHQSSSPNMEAQGAAEFSDADYIGRSVVVKDHKATDGDQLDLRVGDVVYVLEQDETGWWGGHKEGEENTGWFPGSILKCPLEPVTSQANGDLEDASPARDGSAGIEADGSPRQSPVASRKDQQPESVKGSPDTQARTPGGCCASPPAGNNDKFMRDGRMVASPQQADSRAAMTPAQQPGSAAVAAVMMEEGPSGGPEVGELQAENARLQGDLGRLQTQMHDLRRQSSADQTRIHELEQQVRSQEQQIRTQGSAASETNALREKLRREQESLQAKQMANDQMKQLYEEKLKEKAEEKKRDKELARKSIQTEQQRARELELQLKRAQEELETVQREQQAAMASSANIAKVSAGDKAADVNRRLFDAPVERPSSRTPAATEPSMQQRGRNLPKPSESPRQSPQQSPQLSQTRSADNLQHVEEEPLPKAGCVREKVSQFEERCRSQTPSRSRVSEARGRSANAEERQLGRQASQGPGMRAGAVAAAVPTATYMPSRAAAGRAVALSLDHLASEEEAEGCQPFMNMSPINKATGMATAPPQLPSGAMAVPATWESGSGGAATPSCGNSPSARDLSDRSVPRKSAVTEVPVAQRVRNIQGLRR